MSFWKRKKKKLEEEIPAPLKKIERKYIVGDRGTGRTTEAANWAIDKLEAGYGDILWIDMTLLATERAVFDHFKGITRIWALSASNTDILRGMDHPWCAIVLDNYDNYPNDKLTEIADHINHILLRDRTPICTVYTKKKEEEKV